MAQKMEGTRSKYSDEEIQWLLQNLRSPEKLISSSSPWLTACLVNAFIRKNQHVTPYQALRSVFAEVLKEIEAENINFAKILQGRFWDGILATQMVIEGNPQQWEERTFYYHQKYAIRLFSYHLFMKEQQCNNSRIEKVKQHVGKINYRDLSWLITSVGLILFMALFNIFGPSSLGRIRYPGQILNTGGNPPAAFSPSVEPVGIVNVTFDPSPPTKTDTVTIYACTQGGGGIGITLKVSVNNAPDGSENGKWVVLKELAVPCFLRDDAPVWHTNGWNPGTYLIKVEAKTSDDPQWKHPAVVKIPYTLK